MKETALKSERVHPSYRDSGPPSRAASGEQSSTSFGPTALMNRKKLMKSFGKILTFIATALVISGVAIAWVAQKTRIKQRQFEERASATRMTAERGDAKSQFELGDMYYHGSGVSQSYTEALRWYRKAADQRDADAEYRIGYMLDTGRGVQQDFNEALHWYLQAAGKGSAQAECGIGSMYYDGRGVKQDRTEAVRWYRKAADQGLGRAQYDLGYMYQNGQGVPVNFVESSRWYRKAADQGDKSAQRAMGLRGTGLRAFSGLSLSAMLLGCAWILKDSPVIGRKPRSPQQGKLTLAGLFGLAYIGLSAYGSIALFQSISAVNGFYLVKNLVVGIAIGLLVSVFGPQRSKVFFGISILLFVGVSLLVIVHNELGDLATKRCAFCSLEGLLIGVLIASAVLLWAGKRSLLKTAK